MKRDYWKHLRSEVQVLIDLGLTQMQARVYLALAKNVQGRITEISLEANIARPDAYRTLSSLQKAGLVERIIDTPTQYRAVPIQQGASLLLEQKSKEHYQLALRTKRLINSFRERKKQTKTAKEDHHFTLIPPKKTYILKMKGAIDKAQKSVDIILSWKRFAQGIAGVFLEQCQKAWQRNAQFRLIVEQPAKGRINKELLDSFRKHPACQIRFLRKKSRTALSIFDKTEVFVILEPTKDLPESMALWSDNNSIASLAQEYFDMLWLKSAEREPLKR